MELQVNWGLGVLILGIRCRIKLVSLIRELEDNLFFLNRVNSVIMFEGLEVRGMRGKVWSLIL